jgi:hypothetical protein
VGKRFGSGKLTTISLDVLLNAGGQALPDLQAELALLNTGQFIVKSLSIE